MYVRAWTRAGNEAAYVMPAASRDQPYWIREQVFGPLMSRSCAQSMARLRALKVTTDAQVNNDGSPINDCRGILTAPYWTTLRMWTQWSDGCRNSHVRTAAMFEAGTPNGPKQPVSPLKRVMMRNIPELNGELQHVVNMFNPWGPAIAGCITRWNGRRVRTQRASRVSAVRMTFKVCSRIAC